MRKAKGDKNILDSASVFFKKIIHIFTRSKLDNSKNAGKIKTKSNKHKQIRTDKTAKLNSNHMIKIYKSGLDNKNIKLNDELRRNWQILKKRFLECREGYFDAESLEVLAVFEITEGIMLLYFAKNTLAFGALLLDKINSEKILWRSANPIFVSDEHYLPKNILLVNRDITVELHNLKNKSKKVKKIKISLDLLLHKLNINPQLKTRPHAPTVQKSDVNPIIKPRSENGWENFATFNCAAIYLESKVHLVYRAIGNSGLSVLGYAASCTGLCADERLAYPIYNPFALTKYSKINNGKISIDYCSGGGFGGCEDPRLTLIDDIIYMTYTAFNGYEPPGVALTAIKRADFLNKNWHWRGPILISPRGQLHKNWVLFPEKISGKFAILHSISPEIQIDYFDNLDFNSNTVIYSQYSAAQRNNCWDSHLRGVGPPPLKTQDGWLVLYHAMDKRDPHKYKLGAMMLDYNNPTKILYRSTHPILEPSQTYEWNGHKGGVVYSCGAVVFAGKLFIYYGAADTVTCVATADFNDFLSKLKSCRFGKNRAAECLVTIIE